MYDIETENRFWSKILTGDEDECWEIVAMGLIEKGYGQFKVNGEAILAHRFSYQLYHNRLIKDNMVICHTCDNPSCCNPHHLFEGSYQDNMIDMLNKDRANKCKGEKQGRSKLKDKQVLEIRAKYTKGGTTHRKLAEEYGVAYGIIGSIIRRKTWTHI